MLVFRAKGAGAREANGQPIAPFRSPSPRRRRAPQAAAGSRSGSSSSLSSRTRTAPSGSCSRRAGRGYFVLRTLSGIANANVGWSFVIHTALLTATGYSITLLMAAAYRRLIRMRPIITWVGSIVHRRDRRRPASRRSRPGATPPSSSPASRPEGLRFLGAILLTLSLLVAWSALYYSINSYLLLEEQTRPAAAARAPGARRAARDAALPAQSAFPVQHVELDLDLVLLKQTDRRMRAVAPLFFPALHAGQRIRTSCSTP